MRTHAESVHQQFDPQARAYLDSAVHARGPDLERAVALVRAALPPESRALDVGCGAGHLSFALAAVLQSVVATDPSPSMLGVVREAAAQRGVAERIATGQASADALPCPDAHFDLVATRYSAHHWLDLEASLREMRRLLSPGGHLLIIDVIGGATPLVDTHLQAMELLRDPGHVRNRTADEWRALIAASGFDLRTDEVFPVRLDYATWVERMRTPVESRNAIRHLQAGAPRQVHEALAIQSDGSFTVQTGLFWASG